MMHAWPDTGIHMGGVEPWLPAPCHAGNVPSPALHADVAQGDTMHDGVVQCTNFTAHLGRWAVPVTRDDAEYAVCGIDGCF